MQRILACAVAVALAVAAAPDVAQHGADDPGDGADAVVAFVDTGINPYHEVFRDERPRAYQHPSTYLEHYPADAIAMPLTFDADDWKSAVLEDCKLWEAVVPEQLYWFPGTRIVGGISFHAPPEFGCDDPDFASSFTGEPHVLDFNGHGTMVASRGAASGFGACAECLIVAVQYTGSVNLVGPAGSENSPLNAITWTADHNDFIDIQSNSWGPIAPGWDPTEQAGLLVTSPRTARTIEDVSSRQPAFWASGNGAAFRGGALGHPTALSPHLGPSAIIVGGHDSGDVNVWPGFPPHVVADSCAAWAAEPDSLDEVGEDVSGGTSGATPYVAGSAGQMIRIARAHLGDHGVGILDGVLAHGPAGTSSTFADSPLADGEFSVADLRDLLLHTATARPGEQEEDGPTCGPASAPYNAAPIAWSMVPAAYPGYLHIGYGAVDRPAVALAARVLDGSAPMPSRSEEDDFFATHEQLRAALHEVWTTG